MAELAFRIASETLGEAPQPEQALQTIRLIYGEVDQAIEQVTAGVKRACVPGCDHCCHYAVIGTFLEVGAILDFLKNRFTEEQMRALEQKLEAYQRVVAPMFGKNLVKVRTPCPFLEGAMCSVYEVRPLRCRGMNSLDVHACKVRRFDAESLLPLPMAPMQLDFARAANSGLRASFGQKNIFPDDLDVARAVAIALEEPDPIQQHLERGHVFTPAMLRASAAASSTVSDTSFRTYGAAEEPVGRMELGPLREHLQLSAIGHTRDAIAKLDVQHPASLIRNLLVPPFYSSENEIDEWRERFGAAVTELETAEFDPREGFDALEVLQVFELAYAQRDDRELMSRLGDVLVSKITAKALPDLCEPMETRPRSGRLKVGYISANLSGSNGGYWLLGWIRNHCKEIESYALYLGSQADDVTLEFRDTADHFFHLTETAPVNARFVKSLSLDVLIYPDIGLSGRNHQYATMRLAPRQGTGWGHPVTSGLPTIDFYLSSELMEPPNGADHYRERLVKLPGSGLSYRKKKTPVSRLTKSDFRLDEGTLILCCQNPMKLHPHWDFLYREICEKTARPIVFLEGPVPNTQVVKDRMVKAGVNAKWIPNLSAPDFLGIVNLADVCLDTPGWNGANTTIQALTLGKPVISMAGEFMRSRHCLAFLPPAGVGGLVAQSPEEYVELAWRPEKTKDTMRDLDAGALYDDNACVVALDRFLLTP